MDEQQLNKMLNAVKAPAPDESKRKQALEMAMAAFDKNSAEDTQGSDDLARLTDMNSKNNVRRFTMNKPRYAGPMGAVALCALVAVLGTSFYSHQIEGLIGSGEKGSAIKSSKMDAPVQAMNFMTQACGPGGCPHDEGFGPDSSETHWWNFGSDQKSQVAPATATGGSADAEYMQTIKKENEQNAKNAPKNGASVEHIVIPTAEQNKAMPNLPAPQLDSAQLAQVEEWKTKAVAHQLQIEKAVKQSSSAPAVAGKDADQEWRAKAEARRMQVEEAAPPALDAGALAAPAEKTVGATGGKGYAEPAKAKEAFLADNRPAARPRAMPEAELKKDSSSRDDMEMDKVAPAASVPAAPPLPRPEPVMTGQIMASPAPNVMPVAPPVDYDYRATTYQAQNTDAFPDFVDNGITTTSADPVSTFSIDVDTSSYSFVRKLINQGTLPPKGAVRLEEMINYFPYDYALPAKNEDPFKPTVAVYTAPWNAEHKLVHIGIKGYDLTEKPKSNLVFLIDTSGSMNEPDKLPLLVSSFKLMLDSLKADDTVSIVTYAGNAGVALPPTKASDKAKIVDVLNRLQSGGSTAGAEGIRTAYDLAAQNFVKEGNNRVILATDGDFNVGISSTDDLKDFIAKKRGQGIFLSVLGFGDGNYQDATMQALAQNGNGNAAYIDNLNEARKVLVDEAVSTLFTIAKDVKIQVEFNPATVQEYRLIGYETRHLNREDFNNDKIDAGEVGAGHAVTAIYEITPAGATPVNDPLRYAAHKMATPEDAEAKNGNEYAFLKIRYKKPDSDTSTLMTRPITPEDDKKFAELPDDLRFAAAVAGFGQLLRDSKYTNTLTYDQVIEMANGAKGKDEMGYRSEFVNLARLAKSESGTAKPEPVEAAPRR